MRDPEQDHLVLTSLNNRDELLQLRYIIYKTNLRSQKMCFHLHHIKLQELLKAILTYHLLFPCRFGYNRPLAKPMLFQSMQPKDI